MTELTKLSIKDTIAGLKSKKFSATEITNSYIQNIEKNRHLNCFITETFDIALNQAKEADKNIAKGSMRDLEGIPLGIKILCQLTNQPLLKNFLMLERFALAKPTWMNLPWVRLTPILILEK